MHSNVHIIASSSKANTARTLNQPALICSSRSASSDGKKYSAMTTITSADIVALDHSYSLPWKAGVAGFKPAKEQCGIENSPEKIDQIENANTLTPEKLPTIIETEEEECRPQIEESPPSGSINFIFQSRPELLHKSISSTNRSLIFPSNIKFNSSAPPTMSKLESLLKNQVRPSHSRRSPSSFLSPSLNYHRGKKASPDSSGSSQEVVDDNESDVDIDIESVDPDPEPPYDTNKAKNLMKDCEKNLNFLRETEVPEDWEEQIVKTGWTNAQINVFENVLKALHQERLSRLVNQNRFGEPVLRRLSIDKTAQRIRKVLGFYKWNSTLTQWLHGVLVENLSLDYLSAYLDVLQTLRVSLPDFVDRMTVLTTGPPGAKLLINPVVLNNSENSDSLTPGGTSSISALEEANKKNINATAISLVLKRKWDPFSSVIQLSKTKKQPTSPIFVFITANPIKNQSLSKRRKKRFVSLLAGRGKVISVTLNMAAHFYMRVQYYLTKLLKVASQRVRDLKRQYPERPVYAVGWTSGSVLACKLSAIEPVAGVITFGFPMRGIFKKECLSMSALQSSSPSLFVVGGLSNYSSVLDMEVFNQERRSSLLVIGCANDELRIANNYRKRLLVTQSYVDNCIVDEIMKFISKFQLPVSNSKKSVIAPKANKKSKLSASSVVPATELLATNSGKQTKVEDKNEKKNDRAKVDEIKNFTVFDFDGPPTIPSNTSSNKRKAYFRRTPANTSSAETPSSSIPCITASQLVQQSPGVKKRYSKPSGPNVPMPQKKAIIQVQSESTCCIQNVNSLQKQQPSQIMPSTTNADSMAKSVVLNLSNSPQVLGMEKMQESTFACDDVTASKGLICAVDTVVEDSTSDSKSSTNDPGTKPSLHQSPVVPLQDKIVKDAHENSGCSKEMDDSEPVVLTQIRPPSKMLSTNAPIITAPTVLPGGATATPFIRTTVPTSKAFSSAQQQFAPNLYRLLPPSAGSISGQPLLSATPKPTRCMDDLTDTVSSTNNLLSSGSKLFSTEICGANSSISQKSNGQKKTLLQVESVQKSMTKISEIPTVKLPVLEHTKTYILTSRSAKSAQKQTETSANSPTENTISVVDQGKRKTEFFKQYCGTESKTGETISKEAKGKITSNSDTTNNYVKEKTSVNSVKVNSTSAADSDSDDEIQIVSELRPSDPLSLSEPNIEKSLEVSGKPSTGNSTVNNKVTKDNIVKNYEKREEKVEDLKNPSSPELEITKQVPGKVKIIGATVKLTKQKANSKRKVDDADPISKSFMGAVKVVRGEKRSSINREMKTNKSATESTDRRTRKESMLIRSKKTNSGQHAEVKKCRELSNGETDESDDESPIHNKRESEKTRSVVNKKPEKRSINNDASAKRLVSKSQKQPSKESPEVDPPKKLKITSRLSGQSLSKSGNVALKTASKVAMKAPTFFEKRKNLNSDSPASRTRNRSGGNSSTAASSGTASQKSKLPTPRKKARLINKDDLETSDSSIEAVEEVTQKSRAKRTSLQKMKYEVTSSSSSSSSESSDSSEGAEEFEDKEIVPRVTRSMKRQSVPGKL